MMHGLEKSDPAIVATKPVEQGRTTGGGMGGAKGGDRGERGTVAHAPDAVPGKRVTGTGARAAGRKATEEGAVPPH